jgi:hypothetical protein
MEIINTRYELLLKALTTLEESVEFLQVYTAKTHPKLHGSFRDSCIQRRDCKSHSFILSNHACHHHKN